MDNNQLLISMISRILYTYIACPQFPSSKHPSFYCNISLRLILMISVTLVDWPNIAFRFIFYFSQLKAVGNRILSQRKLHFGLLTYKS